MSKRHGKVTRWGTRTQYDVVLMTASGRQTDHLSTWDDLDPGQLKERETLKYAAEGKLVLELAIIKRDGPHLYGMDRAEYFKLAERLD